ncbi:MAG: hypothetical protein ACJAVK_001072 [Akkermansiaceae bacterium]|jgi:hypothetical protein
MKKLNLMLVVLLLCCLLSLQAREILVKYGSNWNYHAGEEKFDPTWKDPDFYEESWENGAAPFVYGHYRGNTIIRHNQRSRPITTYYRTTFNLEDPADWEFFQVQTRADDGAVFYLNGHEVHRENMPRGFIDHHSYAPLTVRESSCLRS